MNLVKAIGILSQWETLSMEFNTRLSDNTDVRLARAIVSAYAHNNLVQTDNNFKGMLNPRNKVQVVNGPYKGLEGIVVPIERELEHAYTNVQLTKGRTTIKRVISTKDLVRI